MSRIRTIKPELFRHEKLFEAESTFKLPLRVAFMGLFTCCDREGRFRWRPRQLKLDILPYENIDFAKVLEALADYGFIYKYECNGHSYGYIPSWHKHQRINNKELASDIPEPPSLISIRNTSESHESFTNESTVNHSSNTNNHHNLPSLNTSQGEEERDMEVEIEGKIKGKEILNFETTNDFEIKSNNTNIIIYIPLNNNQQYPITTLQLTEWQTLYPAINVEQELRNIRAWNLANSNKRKTKSGILKHINCWLSNAQNNSSDKSKSHIFNSQPLFNHNQDIGNQWLQDSINTIENEE
jgi:hypothetical protein